MTEQRARRSRRGWRALLVALSMVAIIPVHAHHRSPNDGLIRGVSIPAIGHGEMPIVARYRSDVLALAARQPVTDPILRRLTGFISLQTFACFWGLVPGSLSDETSPFNECSHAYLAGVAALLAHMAGMPGDQSAATALQARITAEIADDPNRNAICSNSNETFDSADVVGPDWQLVPRHAPTVLAFAVPVGAIFVVLAMAGRRRRFRPKASGVDLTFAPPPSRRR